MTLVIIGVISALTIPSLLQNVENKQYFAAYKKAYAAACNAMELQSNDLNYFRMTSDSDTSGNAQKNFIAFMFYFNVVKNCTNGSNHQECWDDTGEKICNNMPQSNSLAFVDASGMSWAMAFGFSDVIFVDTNGTQGPNHYGKDRWMFMPVDENGKRSATAKTIPVSVLPHGGDYTSYNSSYCQHPPCLYRSALYK